MLLLLILIIVIGSIGAVSFLNINKDVKMEDRNESDLYEISEIH